MALNDALTIAEQIDLPMFTVLVRAGHMERLLADGQPEAAAAHASAVWRFLEDNEPNPTLSPMYVYIQTIHSFRATADNRAEHLIERAHAVLMERADRIADEFMRYQYVNEVRPDRELRALYQQLGQMSVSMA